MKSNKTNSRRTDASPDSRTPVPKPLHDRTAALADGLRKSHREGDMRDREFARQMQEITQEAAE